MYRLWAESRNGVISVANGLTGFILSILCETEEEEKKINDAFSSRKRVANEKR